MTLTSTPGGNCHGPGKEKPTLPPRLWSGALADPFVELIARLDLSAYEIRHPEDMAKIDHELFCCACEQVLGDVEDGDTLSSLLTAVCLHVAGCRRA